MRAKIAVLATLSALLTLGLTGTAEANHAWGSYHWARTSNPFTLALGDNVNGSWDSSLALASSDWTASSVLNTTIVAGTTKPRQCRTKAGRVEVCNASYGNTGWLGIAGISVSGSHITRGYVKVNDTYFNTAAYNTPAWRNLVMCQEVGHTFGLAHQDENFDNANLGTCMDYTNSPESNQHPNAHDYAQLEAIYAHLDSTTTVGATVPSAVPQLGEDPSSWGTEVEGSRASGHSTYVRDLGNGNAVVTFVTWVR